MTQLLPQDAPVHVRKDTWRKSIYEKIFFILKNTNHVWQNRQNLFLGLLFRTTCQETNLAEAWSSFGKIIFPILSCLGLFCLVDSALRCSFNRAKYFSLFMLNTMPIFLLLSLTILLKRSKEYNLPQSQEKQIKCYNSLAVLIQVIILKRF